MASAADLKYFGHAGGSGLDSQPLQTMPRQFIKNVMQAAKWVYPGTSPVIRGDLLSTYDRATDTITGWSYSSMDVIVDEARAAGCRVLIDFHPKNYSANSGDVLQFPMIQPGTGKMDGQMTGVTAMCNHYLQDILDGVVVGFEIYNEPNSIGSIQGRLDGPGVNYSTGVIIAGQFGSILMNGRNVPYYECIGRYVKDSAEAIQDWRAAHGNPFLIVSGPCTGAIDLSYQRAMLDWGYQSNISGGAAVGRNEMTTTQKNNDRGFFVKYIGGVVGTRLMTHDSVHVYQNHDPLTDQGALTKIRTVDTIGTHFRPLLRSYPGGAYTSDNPAISLGILITEGINAGSNKWNRWQTFGGIEGVGKSALDAHGGIINWLDVFGGSQQAANQTSGQLTQPIVQRNFYRKVRSLNAAGAGIEMILPHILIRETDITQADATQGSPAGEQAWQDGRAYFQVPVGGVWSTSSIRFPVADVMRAEIQSYQQVTTGVAPVITTAPTFNDTTPVVGQVLTIVPGTVTGTPTPTSTFEILRSGAVIPGATGPTYTVTAADKPASLSVRQTATNGVAPDAIRTGPGTAAITDPPVALAPVSQSPPVLSDAQGSLSLTNRPNPGNAITAAGQTWSPDATSESWAWQRMAPDGTIEDI